MAENENETSTTRTVINNVNGVIVLGAIAFSTYKIARLAFDGSREGIRALKDRKKKQIEN
jgi:hypothetical protein